MFQIKALSIKTVWDMTRFKTNPLQSAANHKSAQGLVIIAKRWSQISGIIFFVTISYIILTIDVQITVNVYQKRHSLLHLSQIHAPLGTIHKWRWQLFRIFDTHSFAILTNFWLLRGVIGNRPVYFFIFEWNNTGIVLKILGKVRKHNLKSHRRELLE